MIAFLLWLAQQPAPTLSGTTLNTVIEAFAAIAILFVLRAVMDSRDKVRSIWSALYGEKESVEPTGLMYDAKEFRSSLVRLSEDFREHVRIEGVWQEEIGERINAHNNRTHERLTEIEDRISEKRKR